MTFATLESSIDDGGPVQLFRFTYGSEAGEQLAYTDHTQEITYDHGGSIGSVTYAPVPIQRDAINATGTTDRQALGINLDVATELAELFRIYPPSQVINLVIYQGHIDDPDGEFVAIWAGRLLAAERDGSRLKCVGEPITSQMQRPGLRRHYQYGCPHVLYGVELGFGGCAASKAAATVSATIASISGTVLTMNSGWEGALSAAKFLRGQVEWTPAGRSTERRSIIRISGNDLTLSGLPTNLSAGDSVDVILGCNRIAFASQGGDCESLHNALPSFGGHPWIPTENIINKNPYY